MGHWIRATWIVAALATAGCTTADDEERAPTYYQDVAPLLAEHCGSCHTETGIAPFALDDYDTVASLRETIITAVEDGTMPPWLAQETDSCAPKLPFRNDLRLSAEEKSMLRRWVDSGAPAGDAATAAEAHAAPPLEIVSPDADMRFAGPYAVDGEKDTFQCFVLDPGHTEKVWITEAQLTPDNQVVDHHGIVFLDLTGESETMVESDGQFPCFNPPSVPGYIIATWTPGAVPFVTPARSGMPMPPGARIVVQMHYHPTGKGVETDQSSVQLKWTNVEPQWEVAQALVGNFDDMDEDGIGLQPGPNDQGAPSFFIPANVADHVESMIYRQSVPFEFPLWSVGTHMHYVGTDMQIDLKHVFTEGEDECLIHTPKWDFNWQRVYDYDAPIEELPVIGPGDELHMRCNYNNTVDNPFVAQALYEQNQMFPLDVELGEETLDEMCLGLFGIAMPPGVIDELFAD